MFLCYEYLSVQILVYIEQALNLSAFTRIHKNISIHCGLWRKMCLNSFRSVSCATVVAKIIRLITLIINFLNVSFLKRQLAAFSKMELSILGTQSIYLLYDSLEIGNETKPTFLVMKYDISFPFITKKIRFIACLKRIIF